MFVQRWALALTALSACGRIGYYEIDPAQVSGGAGGTGTAGGAGGRSGNGGAGGINVGGASIDGGADAGGSSCASACMRAFISSSAVGNPIGSAANADGVCQALAEVRSLGGSWKAWISDTSSSASARLIHSTLPYHLLDGTLVANDWSDLVDGSIAHPIDVDETGASRAAETLQVWTASDTLGALFSDGQCLDWTSANSTDSAIVGRIGEMDQNWTMAGPATCDAADLHLYCVEQGGGPPPPGPGPANCPSGIAFASPVVHEIFGGPGGSPQARLCPAGQVTIGYTAYEDGATFTGVTGGLAAQCGIVSVEPIACQVSIAAGATFPLDGGTGTNGPLSLSCPTNQMVVAVQGRAGTLADQLSFGCAPLSLSKFGSSYEATVGSIRWLAAEGGPGGSPFTSACPVGEVATGSDIHAGFDIDAFALACAKPVLVP